MHPSTHYASSSIDAATSLHDDLDALMQAAPADNDNCLDDLLQESLQAKQAILEEAQQVKRDADSIKAARQILLRTGVDTATRKHLQDTIRSWEIRKEWTAEASVIVFARQKCECCGSFSSQFQGYAQRQRHRTTHVMRWIEAPKPHGDVLLQRESKYLDSLVEICQECAEFSGWEVEES